MKRRPYIPREAPEPRRVLDDPVPGFYRVRRGRRLPWQPALIWYPCPFIVPWQDSEDPEDWCRPAERRPGRVLRAIVAGRESDPLYVWEWGHTVTAREYHYLVACASTPGQPEARPKDTVDLTQRPSLL